MNEKTLKNCMDIKMTIKNTKTLKWYLYRCLGCDDEWSYYRIPKKCAICGHIEFVKVKEGSR